ncbi:MAG: rRNA pseudouridine synthase [Cryobacterium sp.]|nr:rRNA pseudouridine synthase [Cryobacterium sp.]MBX3090711.1 rRNA pseudouridine synthase [Cryobacterium sp.]MCW5944568.1 rRNA pseudouridine synthase [Cryobacterium sp.]
MTGPRVSMESPEVEGVRLQKLMAAAGVASRRASEDLISAGKVRVNGVVVTELGTRVQLGDRVTVNGQDVQLDTTRRYLMLNKPVGVVSSMADEQGRRDLTEFTSGYPERLFNVGRLDAQTSGLLLLTNDGELAHTLAHPSFGVQKTYLAKTRGRITAQTVGKLRAGIELEDGPISVDSARVIQSAERESLIELSLHSGRNRIVRRMLDAVGHPVLDLVRRSFGPLHLGSLPVGAVRDLTKVEIGQLLRVSRDKPNPEVRAGSSNKGTQPEGKSARSKISVKESRRER